MQNRQSGRRRRSSGPNTRSMGGSQLGNRLEGRVRGNANQLLEKYRQMARDSHQAGDRVAAEYYLQHADHYFRVLNDSRIRHEEMRARRSVFDPYDDESTPGETEAADDSAGDSGKRPASGDRKERAPDPVAKPPVAKPQALELRLSDGEAALMAFGGPPRNQEDQDAKEEVAGKADGADDAAPPKPRRRGRPRKVATAATED